MELYVSFIHSILGYYDTADLIVKKGANVNAVSYNKTALVFALESGKISNLFICRNII